MKQQVHKIASVVHRLELGREVTLLCARRAACVGDVVAVRAKAEKRVYGELELAQGRMAKIFRGDVIVGALGARRALKGFVGHCPPEAGPGDELAILNLGGVIGIPDVRQHQDLGAPCPVEFLGFVADGEQPARVPALPMTELAAAALPPLVVVSGTCMASGKTRAACEIIHELSAAGMRIHAGKLTGVACLRDTLVMRDHGAIETISFLDFGLVSTVDVPQIARYGRAALAHLAAGAPDLIVLELGDGIMGDYGVCALLTDLRDAITVHVFCATDPPGAWGGREFLRGERIPIDVVSGPVTDNTVGAGFVRSRLDIPAVNACTSPAALVDEVRARMEKRR